jgi:hypothetical protein
MTEHQTLPFSKIVATPPAAPASALNGRIDNLIALQPGRQREEPSFSVLDFAYSSEPFLRIAAG